MRFSLTTYRDFAEFVSNHKCKRCNGKDLYITANIIKVEDEGQNTILNNTVVYCEACDDWFEYMIQMEYLPGADIRNQLVVRELIS